MSKSKLGLVIVFTIILTISLSIFPSCAAEPEVVVETVTETVTETVVETVEVEKEQTPEEDGAKRIVYVTPCFNFSPDWNVAHKWFLDKCREYGYIGTVVGPNEINAQIMIEDMEVAIADQVDGIAACPLVPDQFVPTYDKAMEEGIPIVDVAIDSGHEAAISFVGTDYEEVGKTAADKIVEKADAENLDSANVLVVYTGPESENQEQEIEAFLSAVEENDYNIEIVDRVFDKSQVDLAAELSKASLTAYPEINFIWCVEGAAPQGVSTAVQELGLVGKVHILGIDMQPKTVEDMEAGIIWASFEQNFPGWGGTPVDLLKDYWAGEDIPRVVDSGVTFWAQEDLEEYYATH